MIPMPTQLAGAKFLAEAATALLADAPRCGKTGTAIMAADYLFAKSILVVTTASGRSVWQRAFKTWSNFGRRVDVLTPKDTMQMATDVAIVGWPSINDAKLRTQLLRRRWDLIIADEAHAAKTFTAARTRAFYGDLLDDDRLLVSTSLADKAAAVWCLTGTPMPNSPLDIFPMLRALAPERLMANPERGWPDVHKLSEFKKRYCVIKPKKIGHGYRAHWIDVVVGGRNESELAARIEGFILLRTQADVGIVPPVYETFPLIVSAANREVAASAANSKAILEAAERGDTKTLDLHLGPILRLTGEIKARAVVDAVKDEFDGGLDKIVLAYWHKNVGAILLDGLSEFGVVGIDGMTSSDNRLRAEQMFHEPKGARVFLAQIVAAGEAIDLSAARELMFVETSFQPAQMRQMSDRITNIKQAGVTRVRVATLAGSIDDALQEVLLRKWSSIRKVLQ